MAAEPQQIRDDHLRAAAGAGAFDSGADGAQAIFKVGAVDGVAFDAVADGAIDERSACELTGFGRGISVLVVRDDEDQREFFDGSLIDRFVAGTGAGAAFTNGGCADSAGFS